VRKPPDCGKRGGTLSAAIAKRRQGPTNKVYFYLTEKGVRSHELCPDAESRAKGEGNKVRLSEPHLPTHRERQFMQHLRAGGWVKPSAIPVSAGPALVANLLKKGWIEQRGAENDLCYRITEKGLAAKKMPLRIYT
jgi:predicted transcriptional regulator